MTELRPRWSTLRTAVNQDSRWLGLALGLGAVLVFGIIGAIGTGELVIAVPALLVVAGLAVLACFHVLVPRIRIEATTLEFRTSWGTTTTWPLEELIEVVDVDRVEPPWWDPEHPPLRRRLVSVIDRDGRLALALRGDRWTQEQLGAVIAALPHATVARYERATVDEITARHPGALPIAMEHPIRTIVITALAITIALAATIGYLVSVAAAA
ncbi:hypothetical protein [uncultured Schumannella sp.]|uniref:hypothetical protein n=1 Tax=uncultured Schumannella sp. TaxID=1195956 RepID=UPI0025D90981|nr:hypothetical protein [uncultured Schumannella sp.]